MKNNFEGDPRLYQGVDGSYFIFRDGQPVMDQGFENQAEIAILTEPGWVGNYFLPAESQIGSNFIHETRKSITRTTINNLKQIAEIDLKSKNFGTVTAEITNPESNIINSKFVINPPGETAQELLLIGSAQNWKSQAVNPAYRRK